MVVVTKRTSGVPEILAQNSRLSCWRIESAEQQCTQLGGAQPFSNGPRINLLIKPESIIFAPMIPDSLNIPAIITIPSFEMQGVFLVIGFLKSMGRTPFPEKLSTKPMITEFFFQFVNLRTRAPTPCQTAAEDGARFAPVGAKRGDIEDGPWNVKLC